MPGRPFRLSTIAVVIGYAAVALAIAATALHFHDRRSAVLAAPSVATDPLAPELAHCQAIGLAAKDNTACAAAWAENRLRFFGPAGGAASPHPEGR